jgi:hypothetical protein
MPDRATPPIAWPVWRLTNSGSARSTALAAIAPTSTPSASAACGAVRERGDDLGDGGVLAHAGTLRATSSPKETSAAPATARAESASPYSAAPNASAPKGSSR